MFKSKDSEGSGVCAFGECVVLSIGPPIGEISVESLDGTRLKPCCEVLWHRSKYQSSWCKYCGSNVGHYEGGD